MLSLTELIVLFCCFNLTILEFIFKRYCNHFHAYNKDFLKQWPNSTKSICGFLCFCRRAVCVEHYVICIHLCLLKVALLCMSLCVCVCWICFYCQMKLKYPLQKMQTWKNGPLCPSISTLHSNSYLSV